MPNILDEYLIKLGAVVDTSGMAKFNMALRQATSFVDTESTRMAARFLKAQTAIVGGFAAMGGAALGLVDKVAMSDQNFRLFALHMFMTKDAARGLKTAMDALGQPLENLTWDPELRGRTHQLLADQRAMAPSGNFEEQMRKIRDIRFEFTRMEVELEYLGYHVVQDFMQALGIGPDTLLKKLQGFNDWVTHNLPAISKKLVTEFIPVWRDIEEVGKVTAATFKDVAVAFTNVIGLLTNNSAIMGTSFSMDNLAKALQSVVHGFAYFAEAISGVEDILAHLMSALTLMLHFRFSEAGQELKSAAADVSYKSALGALGAAGGSLLGGVAGGPVGAMLLGGLGATAGAGLGSVIGGTLDDRVGRPNATEGLSFSAVLDAIRQQESGNLGQSARSPKGAVGLYQLMPETAKSLGVNPYDAADNARGGALYYKQLLAHYHGNVAEALGGYNAGPGRMDSFLAGRATLPAETKNYIAQTLGRAGASGDVQVGSITITIAQPNATPRQIQQAVTTGVRNATAGQTRRNLYEFNDLAPGY